METVRIGIVGAGNRGHWHAAAYESNDHARVVAVADVDETAAGALASEYDVPAVYDDAGAMVEDVALDAVSVCVHNNLHEPVAVRAFEAGAHVFCEKPLAGSYADAESIVSAAAAAGRHLGVQNRELFAPETRAARTLVEAGELGECATGRAVASGRRGRPYVDGYATPAFVSTESAGGGPVLDVGTYEIGRLLYLMDNPAVQRVSGTTFDHTAALYTAENVGEHADTYRERIEEAGYDVEDAGLGTAILDGGVHLTVVAAWHRYADDRASAVTGSGGGISFDPFEFYTTIADYEATVSFDIDEYELRHGRLESETGYESDRPTQFDHWIDTVRGTVDPIPTGEIAYNSMRLMEGIYRSAELDREVTAAEIAERSESLSGEL